MVRSDLGRTMHDVTANRALLETYAAEAQRIEARLPVPAHLWLAMTLPGFGLFTAQQEAVDRGIVAHAWPLGIPDSS